LLRQGTSGRSAIGYSASVILPGITARPGTPWGWKSKIRPSHHFPRSGGRVLSRIVVRVSHAAFYIWRKLYGGLQLTELRELRQLRRANNRLKRAGGGPEPGQADPAGDRVKNAVKQGAPEVVVAAKLHAIVILDIRNSRMKDFYDLWFLARTRSLGLDTLRQAVLSTFERRRTPIPVELPFALTDGFLTDTAKIQQWNGFLRRLRLEKDTPDLETLGKSVAEFAEPVFRVPAEERTWSAGGPWRK
jgi:hypothetical protein